MTDSLEPGLDRERDPDPEHDASPPADVAAPPGDPTPRANAEGGVVDTGSPQDYGDPNADLESLPGPS